MPINYMDQPTVPESTGTEEAALETGLRPTALIDYIGQEPVKRHLDILLTAAKQRHEPIEHILLHGGPGLGKTTLANIIAREMNANIRITSGPAIERAGDLAAIITNLQPGDVLFIDEIHRLHKVVEEMLYPAMEDFALDVVIGKGPSARSLRLELPKFTIIGATTRPSLIAGPLRDRFGVQLKLDFYSLDDMQAIVQRSAALLGMSLDVASARAIAGRSRRTPRIANRLLKRVRDYAQVHHNGVITVEGTAAALDLLEVDQLGLNDMDRRLLRAIAETFSGGPVGVQTLAAALAEESETIEEIYEPFLIQLGFLQRTARGRIVTPAGYHHIGLTPPALQPQLQL